MREREMLEMAAKAYWGDEMDDVCSIEWSEEDQAIAYTHGDNQDHNGRDVTLIWNPLTDDGDALRLAVKLELIVDTHGSHVQVSYPFDTPLAFEKIGDDPCAATRLAITRAAAEIGKAMRASQ